MFAYKDASFYDSYFKNLPDFDLVESFSISKETEDNNHLIGYIDAKESIYPMHIQVDIPTNFPHGKLLFFTNSLHGYPHLIYTGPKKDLGWFCLNTPFAETAEEQLNQEMDRLRGWMKQYMRSDLPKEIKDPKVLNALLLHNGYAWENPEEIRHYSKHNFFTFVGNFAEDVNYFKEKKGFMHCVKNQSGRYFALKEKSGTNFEMPFVIEEEIPKDANNFFSLKKQYGWDEEMCKHLLPEICFNDRISSSGGIFRKDYTQEEAVSIIDEELENLDKEESLLMCKIGSSAKDKKEPMTVPLIHKDFIRQELKKWRTIAIEKKGLKKLSLFEKFKDISFEEDEYNEYLADKYFNEFQFFLLGIKSEENLFWLLIFTCNNDRKVKSFSYDLQINHINIETFEDIVLSREGVQSISENDYFGRGSFSQNLRDAKIGVVGLGAIGSMVCEALARGGASVLGLWDEDTVEPGNICRSAFITRDLGESKIKAIIDHLKSINPFINFEEIHNPDRCWNSERYFSGPFYLENGSFYGSINYQTQEEVTKTLEPYDLLIDCTGSNEMLHFLSYAFPDKKLISLGITNRAKNLLCMSNRDGNPFELRKLYLSKIEQDTQNYYVEGDGCYSPTFLASYCDIAPLVGMAIRELDQNMANGELMHSIILAYESRGIVAEKLRCYKLDDSPLRMTISTETLMDGQELPDCQDGRLGYLLGGYSANGDLIMISHFIAPENANDQLEAVFRQSKGIIDYIGDFTYSQEESGTYSPELEGIMAAKASNPGINTNNPILAVRNPDGSISFFLYIASHLEPLKEI